jgi:hypothetical protein
MGTPLLASDSLQENELDADKRRLRTQMSRQFYQRFSAFICVLLWNPVND